MSRLTVVMVDNDEIYLEPLELKFIEEYGDNAEIIVISDDNYLETYFSIPRNIDLLIINEYLYLDHIKRHKIRNTFILAEDEGSTEDFTQNRIYKYTSVVT